MAFHRTGARKEIAVSAVPVPMPIGTPHARAFLSPRERQVLSLLGNGDTSKEIAAVLGISDQSVAAHRKSICRKLKLHSTAELVHYATMAAHAMD